MRGTSGNCTNGLRGSGGLGTNVLMDTGRWSVGIDSERSNEREGIPGTVLTFRAVVIVGAYAASSARAIDGRAPHARNSVVVRRYLCVSANGISIVFAIRRDGHAGSLSLRRRNELIYYANHRAGVCGGCLRPRPRMGSSSPPEVRYLLRSRVHARPLICLYTPREPELRGEARERFNPRMPGRDENVSV